MKVIIDSVSKRYGSGNDEDGSGVLALSDVSMEVSEEEFVCILGPSGCGKSTLLQIVAGLEEPSKGRVVFRGMEQGRRTPVATMVFQQFAIFPWMTVMENIAFPLRVRGIGKKQRFERSKSYVQMLQLEGFEDKYPGQLSGGMQQRVAIGRALVSDPDVLLMDEPFGALDAQTRLRMQEELLDVWDRTRKGVLFVTHSIEEALLLGDYVIVLSARPGRIIDRIDVPFSRPRAGDLRTTSDFLELHEHVWAMLKDEVEA